MRLKSKGRDSATGGEDEAVSTGYKRYKYPEARTRADRLLIQWRQRGRQRTQKTRKSDEDRG